MCTNYILYITVITGFNDCKPYEIQRMSLDTGANHRINKTWRYVNMIEQYIVM